jgi:hypothetical protein
VSYFLLTFFLVSLSASDCLGAGAAFLGAGAPAFLALRVALADAFDIINLRNTINSYKKQKPQEGAFEIKKT